MWPIAGRDPAFGVGPHPPLSHSELRTSSDLSTVQLRLDGMLIDGVGHFLIRERP
jgi:hypothetical protein